MTYSTILPISCLLALNINLFIPIIRKVQGHITTRMVFEANYPIKKSKRNYLLRRVQVTISCTLLLGITWMFGYLSYGALKDIFQWLFAICNSFQGVFLFVFHVVFNERVMSTWRKKLSTRQKFVFSSPIPTGRDAVVLCNVTTSKYLT